ncbi:four-carbon acid sugar kinase family protein [Evansella halocellulosilytica]|uniref:four-carbon acid sugar kinase family protein n=1 Tax=Evansella halocellulosilytica TaxID=2011013 RepID=UPI000BB75087|nr:four-carbon acid sugar kinase family protein [Evansella halocellulosilytica]
MKIGIVADDLTGANATGVRLSKQGIYAATMVQGANFPETTNYDAIVIDTDSRYSTPEIAKKRTQQAMDHFKKWGAQLFSKRIDSTFRGNIGVEIDAILEDLGKESIAVVVPSFPDSGRIVLGGYLLVDDVPLQQTDVANDPVHPINESYIPSLMKKQTKHEVEFLGLKDILGSLSELTEKLETAIENGNRVIVCDATTNDQVEHIAEAMALIPNRPIISADPGPLTAAYAKAVRNQKVEQERILVTVGSATKLTGQQLHYLIEKTEAKPVYVNPKPLASYTSSWDEEIERATEEALEAKDQSVLIITTHLPGHSLINLAEIAKQENVSEDALAKRITDGLAKISRKIIEDQDSMIKGCFSSGGDVTASLCSISLASGIQLEDEVLPLAAYGKLIGGHFHDLPIITKGGMIGNKKSIYECVKFLQTKL